jgi:hypothetical protein
MRRLLTALALGLVAVAVLAGPAAAKEMSVSLSGGGPPSNTDPGEPWNARLLVHGEPDILAEATPGIFIRNDDTGETRTFDARRTGRRAADGQLIYRVRVVFPSEGGWSYTLIDGVTDRAYEGSYVQVGDAPPAEEAAPETSRPSPAAAPADDDSFPLWPVLGGIGAFVLAAGAAVVVLRQRRPQPTA